MDLDVLPESDPVRDQYEVTLGVPRLAPALGFYARLLGVDPVAAERRVAWFDVPETPLRLAIRETADAGTAQVRICVNPAGLRATADRLRQHGHRIHPSGLAPDGHARAISIRDPGGNALEFCAPLSAALPPARPHRRRAASPRAFARVLRGLLGRGPIEERFARAQARDHMLMYRS